MNEYEFGRLLVAVLPPVLIGGVIFWVVRHFARARYSIWWRRFAVCGAALITAISVVIGSGHALLNPELSLALHILGAVVASLSLLLRRTVSERDGTQTTDIRGSIQPYMRS